jgi:hypothetical protein
MLKKYTLLISLSFLFLLFSCGSIKSTLQTVDNTIPKPPIVDGHFLITEYASNSKYGYDADYPINVGFDNEKYSIKSINYFLNALTGSNGETLKFEKKENCCPFPTERSAMGGGILEIYEVSFAGKKEAIRLYFNINDKGKLLCPKGFSIKPIKELK